MELGIGHIFSIIAAFQSIFISLILLNKKNRNQSNWILFFLFFFFAILLIDTMASSREVMPQLRSISKIIILFTNTPLIIAPIIFLYVRSVRQPDFKLTYHTFYHFIPALLITFFFIYYWYPKPKVHMLSMDKLYYLITIFILAQNFIYLILIIANLSTYKSKINTSEKLSKLPNIKLPIHLSITFILLWTIDLTCLIIYDLFKNADYCAYSRSSYYSVGFIALSLLLYWAVLYPDSLFLKNKYKFSRLNNSQREDYKKKIIDYLYNEKPYLDPKINLAKLAGQLGIPPNDLSQIVNQQLNKSFIEFINDFRIEEFKRQLKNIDQENHKYIADIYYSVGFNSKSAFYSAFKKSTGLTPKEYQQQKHIYMN